MFQGVRKSLKIFLDKKTPATFEVTGAIEIHDVGVIQSIELSVLRFISAEN